MGQKYAPSLACLDLPCCSSCFSSAFRLSWYPQLATGEQQLSLSFPAEKRLISVDFAARTELREKSTGNGSGLEVTCAEFPQRELHETENGFWRCRIWSLDGVVTEASGAVVH